MGRKFGNFDVRVVSGNTEKAILFKSKKPISGYEEYKKMCKYIEDEFGIPFSKVLSARYEIIKYNADDDDDTYLVSFTVPNNK